MIENGKQTTLKPFGWWRRWGGNGPWGRAHEGNKGMMPHVWVGLEMREGVVSQSPHSPGGGAQGRRGGGGGRGHTCLCPPRVRAILKCASSTTTQVEPSPSHQMWHFTWTLPNALPPPLELGWVALNHLALSLYKSLIFYHLFLSIYIIIMHSPLTKSPPTSQFPVIISMMMMIIFFQIPKSIIKSLNFPFLHHTYSFWWDVRRLHWNVCLSIFR